MNLTNLKKIARASVPGGKANVIKNPLLELILNEVVIDIVTKTKCLPADEKFGVVAGTYEYNLNTKLTRYLLPDESGLWWNDDGAQWRRMYPRTRKYLDKHYPYWKNDSSTDPMRYFIEGDILTIHRTPDTTLADGFHFFFFQKPIPMTVGTHFPFGNTVEISRLSFLSETINLGWVYRALKIIRKKDSPEIAIAKKEYDDDIIIKTALLKRRSDVSASDRARMQGHRIC